MLEHIESLIQQHRHQEGGLMPLLHSLQDALGYVPAEAVAPIAKGFNLTRAEVHGVITYYHHFRSNFRPFDARFDLRIVNRHRQLQVCTEVVRHAELRLFKLPFWCCRIKC